MLKTNKWLIVFNYLSRLFLIWVYIPHGWEKLTTKIDPQEYADFGLGKDFTDFYLILGKNGIYMGNWHGAIDRRIIAFA